MSRSILRYTSLLCCLLLLTTVGGVFATWHFAETPAKTVIDDVGITLSEFVWKPVEILPTESEIGENHLALIELVLNENEKGYGLNFDSKNVLEGYLNKYGVVFSNQKTSGGNLKFVSDETNQLYYCIEKISDTIYYAYSFSRNDLSMAIGTYTAIPVYRTILEKTDKWEAPRSYFGYAQTKPLRDMNADNASGTLAYSIDVSTWTQG